MHIEQLSKGMLLQRIRATRNVCNNIQMKNTESTESLVHKICDNVIYHHYQTVNVYYMLNNFKKIRNVSDKN